MAKLWKSFLEKKDSLDTSFVYFLNIYTRVCIKKDREWHNSVWKPHSFYIVNDEILQKAE